MKLCQDNRSEELIELEVCRKALHELESKVIADLESDNRALRSANAELEKRIERLKRALWKARCRQ